MSGSGRLSIALLSAALIASACSPITRSHGFVPTRGDLDQLILGADTKASVADTLGTPGASGIAEDGAWFYVQNTVETLAFLAPKVVERRVVMLEFDQADILRETAEYGLEDGRVINLQTRVTPTDSRRVSILARILGNVSAAPLAPLPRS